MMNYNGGDTDDHQFALQLQKEMLEEEAQLRRKQEEEDFVLAISFGGNATETTTTNNPSTPPPNNNNSSFLKPQPSSNRKPTTANNNNAKYMSCPLCRLSISEKNFRYHVNNCISRQERKGAEVEENDKLTKNNNKKCRQSLDISNANSSSSEIDITSSSSSSSSSTDWSFLNGPQTKTTCNQPVPGLFIFPAFLTNEETTTLMEALHNPNIEPQSFALGHFNGQHLNIRWGVHPITSKEEELASGGNPSPCLPGYALDLILPKLEGLKKRIPGLHGFNILEANAIEYCKTNGDSLAFHSDNRFLSKDLILNVSVSGECEMSYRCTALPTKKGLSKKPDYEVGDVRKVLLQAGTLQVMSGESRYNWEHGILNKDIKSSVDNPTGKRISMTFRETIYYKERTNGRTDDLAY